MLVDAVFPTLAEMINVGLAIVVGQEETAKSYSKVDNEEATTTNPKSTEFIRPQILGLVSS